MLKNEYWNEFQKPTQIKYCIQKICKDILRRGEATCYQNIYDHLFEMIDEDFDKYLPEDDYA